jgi:molybdopterin-dependent oxidoreductase alpha subunit
MGIYEKPSAVFLKSIKNTFHFSPPTHHGYDVVDAIKAMHSGKATVFFAMGGNFLSATPDTNYTAEALRNCDLTVHVSTKLNRSHLVHGKEAFILPCLGRTDHDTTGGTTQFVSCENSMGVVQSSRGMLRPVSEDLLSEPAIVCRLAKAVLGDATTLRWDHYLEHYDNIRTDIERVVPGFENYKERVRKPGGFYLPNGNREGIFATPSAKANFNIAFFMPVQLQKDELMMTTIRSHDQFNTTVYGLNDRYRGIYNERRVVLMNATDMVLRSIASGDLVDVYNQEGGIERIARKFVALSYPIPKDCTAMYFPEANVLVPISSVAEKSNTPSSKMVVVKVRKSGSEEPC